MTGRPAPDLVALATLHLESPSAFTCPLGTTAVRRRAGARLAALAFALAGLQRPSEEGEGGLDLLEVGRPALAARMF
eukprot:12388406-Alexandrium_andersonii.AAC.1